MARQDDEEYLEYKQCVYSIWAVSCNPRSFADDLIPCLMEAGFIIDNVTVCISGEQHIRWEGTCYDVGMIMYRFVATWTLNMDKFCASEVHYYDLSDIDIEPLRRY